MRRFGLIGKKLGHSFSARYFAEKFEREGLQDCDYSLYELPEIECVKEFMLKPNLVGFNVTIPYKQQVIPYLDDLHPQAAEVGAVNCVQILPDGRKIGYNTDVDGVRVSLNKLLGGDKVESALILGTGGAAQAVDYVLRERGIELKVVSRDKSRGDLAYDDLTQDVLSAHRLIINASPVGMFPACDDAPAIPYAMLSGSHYLFDLVYNPLVTRFMELGAAQGAKTLSGIDMLYAQAESAWRIWNE
ncbi:MAG: shikimate dehydrogenase [Rikenellaceae bacterium]|nr:shikimate dehydrogenase [Rikenellaceae bacterium]